MVREKIVEHCCDIGDLFIHGATVTVIVRSPHGHDGDVIVTSDTIPDVMRALLAAIEREPAQQAKEGE